MAYGYNGKILRVDLTRGSTLSIGGRNTLDRAEFPNRNGYRFEQVRGPPEELGGSDCILLPLS